MSIQIDITQNGTTTLATAGKYCDRNVDISVSVDTATPYNEGLAQGKDEAWNTFWDTFQANGERQYYFRAFTYCVGVYGWTDETYNPKYTIVCKGTNGARSIFEENTNITDVKVPIIIDGTSMNSTFYGATAVKRIPSLTLQNGATFTAPFGRCYELEEMIVYGTIENNGFDLRNSSKLNHDSIVSIINALSNTTSGLTVALSATAKANAFTNEEWATLIATKTNWTISLV